MEKQAVYHRNVNVTLFWNAVGLGEAASDTHGHSKP